MFEEFEFAHRSTTNVPRNSKNDDVTASNSSRANAENVSTVAITKVDKDLIVDATEQEENVAQNGQLCCNYSATG